MKNLDSDITVVLVLMLVFILGVVFFPAVSAYADAGGSHGIPHTTAGDAASAADETTMRNFVLHAKHHLDTAAEEGAVETSVLLRQMRDKEGDWIDGSVYLIVARQNGYIWNHGKDTRSFHGTSLGRHPVAEKLLGELRGGSVDADPVCEEYTHPDGSLKWSCAALIKPLLAGGEPNLLIGGLDHDDQYVDRRECPEVNPEVTAEDVIAGQYVSEERGKEVQKDFVKAAIQRVENLLTQDPPTQQSQQLSPLQYVINQMACFGEGPWKSGPIYVFVMVKYSEGVPTVVFNGNNPELTGSPFENVFDEDGVDIGREILEVAGEDGEGGFVKYKWDNPLIADDDVQEPGRSPGRSPKISYVEAVDFTQLPGLLIFGSGIYGTLEQDSVSSDDGCAIAGSGDNSQRAVFNLLLIMFSMCCLSIFWKGRSKKQSKFNDEVSG